MSLCTKANAFFTSRRSKALHLAARVLKSDPYVSVGTPSVRGLYAYTFNEYEAVRVWLELNERPVTAFISRSRVTGAPPEFCWSSGSCIEEIRFDTVQTSQPGPRGFLRPRIHPHFGYDFC